MEDGKQAGLTSSLRVKALSNLRTTKSLSKVPGLYSNPESVFQMICEILTTYDLKYHIVLSILGVNNQDELLLATIQYVNKTNFNC